MGVAKNAVRDHRKHSDSLSRLKQVKAFTHTGSLCQQNMGAVNIKQKPVMMGGRTTHRALSPKRTPFQTVTNK
jgi:hypothetical protein